MKVALDLPLQHQARMFDELLAATVDMAVLGCSFDKLRTSSPCDVPIRYASGPIPRYRGTVVRRHINLHGLATVIHETSGLRDSECKVVIAPDPPS